MNFSGVTVLCVGDVMLDRFVHGDIERISPEAPVPVIRLTRTDEMLGGAGNVANNVAALGGRALLVGLVGEDSPADTLRRLASATTGIDVHLAPSVHRPTICKTRFVASHQQVVRADEESRLPLQADEEQALLAALDAAIGQADAVILSDYGKGVLSDTVIARARAAGVPLFVDPKAADYAIYRGATCITPNLKELAAASGMEVGEPGAITRAAQCVMASAEADAILVTRSALGMMLVEASGAVHAAPALAREVFDVSGAGDTVIAALALAVAAGRTMVQAMHIANAAAGVVVSKLGTATASVAEVLNELENQEHAAGIGLPGLRTLPATEALVARWKQQGLRVGFTNGCFDILHPGHVSLLKAARPNATAGGRPEHRCERPAAEGTGASSQRPAAPRAGHGGNHLCGQRRRVRRADAAPVDRTPCSGRAGEGRRLPRGAGGRARGGPGGRRARGARRTAPQSVDDGDRGTVTRRTAAPHRGTCRAIGCAAGGTKSTFRPIGVDRSKVRALET